MLTCRPVVLLNRATCADRTDTPLMKAFILSMSSRVMVGSGVVRSAGVAALLGLSALACEPAASETPVRRKTSTSRSFSGFARTEVNVESKSFQCETRLCLVNHFQGPRELPVRAELTPASQPELLHSRARRDADHRSPSSPQDSAAPPQRLGLLLLPLRQRGRQQGRRRALLRVPERLRLREVDRASTSAGGKAQLAGFYCIKQGTRFSGV